VAVSSGIASSASDVLSVDAEKRMVKNGNLSIRVDDAEWSADEIDRIATRLGGFTASRTISDQGISPLVMMQNTQTSPDTKESGPGNVRSGTVVIKVPSEKFAEAQSSIKGIAKVVISESSSASDIMAQFVDLEARLKNKYAEEASFTKILDTNTGKVSDVLEVTREISNVRGEIEQLETQKKYMESQTDMAELSISLTEDTQIRSGSNTWRPGQTVKDAVNHLAVQFRSFVDGTLYFVISVLPFFLLYLLGVYMLYRIGVKIYAKLRG
jgi:predicted house-cleaning noncanonical NTP pyrophosphatase (MazG superfamily)